MKVAALFSGGKDSCFALYYALSSGWEVSQLVSVFSSSNESYMYHFPNISTTLLAAKSLGVPHVIVKTSGEKEKELEPLYKALKDLKEREGIEGVIVGALASEYQKTRVERICHELNLKSFAHLWHKDQAMLLREQAKAGFHTVIVGVYAHGFDASWLGRVLDEKAIQELEALNRKYGISVGGEGGEYETLVLDMPLFSKRIEITQSEKSWNGVRGELTVINARLVAK